MVSAPQSGQVDSGLPREGGLAVCDGRRWFSQQGVCRGLGEILGNELFVDPGFFSASWGFRRYLNKEIAVVRGWSAVDVPGGGVSVVEMVAGMLRVGNSGK